MSCRDGCECIVPEDKRSTLLTKDINAGCYKSLGSKMP